MGKKKKYIMELENHICGLEARVQHQYKLIESYRNKSAYAFTELEEVKRLLETVENLVKSEFIDEAFVSHEILKNLRKILLEVSVAANLFQHIREGFLIDTSKTKDYFVISDIESPLVKPEITATEKATTKCIKPLDLNGIPLEMTTEQVQKICEVIDTQVRINCLKYLGEVNTEEVRTKLAKDISDAVSSFSEKEIGGRLNFTFSEKEEYSGVATIIPADNFTKKVMDKILSDPQFKQNMESDPHGIL